MKKFLRRDANRFAKFSNGKGKKAKWRSPKGRDNKMREKRRGYPAVVSIGYASDKKDKERISGLITLHVRNLSDLEKATKENIIIVGKVGKKNKIQILEKIKEMKLSMDKTTVERVLEKIKKVENKKDVEKNKGVKKSDEIKK